MPASRIRVGELGLNVVDEGHGPAVLLLHGYAQNSHMWRPLMKELAKTHLVVAPDLRGFGDSAKPESGYDKKTMAQDVRALARPTLQHRILLNYRAEAEGVRSGEIVDRLLAGMRLP